MAEKAQANFALREDSFRRRVAVGVRLAMGSDSAGESHGDNLIQLRLMHEMRLDGLAVLRAATGSAATLMGVANRIGFIRADHQADLTVVDGDPLDFRAYPANVRHAYRPGAHMRG
jgi:imidazolonepropionase-like amidohydrolase